MLGTVSELKIINIIPAFKGGYKIMSLREVSEKFTQITFFFNYFPHNVLFPSSPRYKANS